MSQTEQLPMAFSSDSRPRNPSDRVTTRPRWLGSALDHRTLVDALQDEWLRPPAGASGHLLGMCAFPPPTGDVGREHRITVWLTWDPALLPERPVLIRRHGRWTEAPISQLAVDDEAVFWPGMLPTFAIAEIQVASDEERVRLTGLARQVSNVTLPAAPTRMRTAVATLLAPADAPTAPPPDSPGPIEFPPHMDAVRGAMAVAFWALPRIAPWYDLMCASLGTDDAKLAQSAASVSAPWWSTPPWRPDAKVAEAVGSDGDLWHAALRVFEWKHSRDSIGGIELAEAIAREAGQSATRHEGTSAVGVAPNAWLRETTRILRAESTVTFDGWKSAPVGKAIQLVLARPEPSNFKTWLDELPELPPAIWWSAATLCGLLHGYRRLAKQFRGEPALRRLLALHSLRIARMDGDGSPRSTEDRAPSWRRLEGGEIGFSWSGSELAPRPESGRGRWFAADLEEPAIRRAAGALASQYRWPCFQLALEADHSTVTVSAPVQVINESNQIHIDVRERVRFVFAPGTTFEAEFDAALFQRCVATEGGAHIPGPPSATNLPLPIQTPTTQVREYPVTATPTLIAREPAPRPSVAIPGLVYVTEFLTEAEERALVSTIDAAMWSDPLQRRVQHYGWRYDYKMRRIDTDMRLGPLPGWADELAKRLLAGGLLRELPDQVIVNEYIKNQGISKHTDCEPCFADGIAMISLLESWEMNFRQAKPSKKVAHLLERRSVAVMTQEARYGWTHEIPPRLKEPGGLRRERRISVTFRKVIAPAST